MTAQVHRSASKSLLTLGIIAAAGSLLLTGCQRVLSTDYHIPNSGTNRVIVGNIVRSVAQDCGLRDDSARLSDLDLVAGFAYWGSSSKRQITLIADVYQGELKVGLGQVKIGKRRTKKFREIEQALTSQLQKAFGTGVKIKSYDEWVP